MNDTRLTTGQRFLMQAGAIGAVLGAILQVAAGTGSTSLPSGEPAAVLRELAGSAGGWWQIDDFGFMFGALLWVVAIVALADTLTDGPAWALGRLAVALVIVGATMHALYGALHGAVLPSLARDWATADTATQTALAANAATTLRMLEAVWAGMITLFHGVPFILAGLAATASWRYPAWLGWIGAIGGAGSVVVGIGMFFGMAAGLAVPFAIVISVFMVILGWLLWQEAAEAPQAELRAAAGREEPRPM
jgi:hypothetical protein